LGPEPIKGRMNACAKVLVTTETLHQKKVEPHRTSIPDLERVLLVGESSRRTAVFKTEDCSHNA
jgi:acetyl-CoA synthetase